MALCQPYGTLTGRDALADIAGKSLRRKIEFACRNTADDLDHTVRADEILYELVLYQIVSHANFRRLEIVLVEHPLENCRIQNDIPVVRQHEKFPTILDIRNPVIRKIVRRRFQNPFYYPRHYHILEIVYRLHLKQLFFEIVAFLVRVEIF